MEITAKQMLNVLQVLAWIIFFGLCIDACGIISNTVYVFWFKPEAAHQLWNGMDLSSLYAFDRGHFLEICIHLIIVAVLKTVLFGMIVKYMHNKKLNLEQPFSQATKRLVSGLAWFSVAIGVFSSWAVNKTQWIASKGVTLPTAETLSIGGADVWFFMAIVLMVIAQIFKRGIEIQNENDLTI